MILIKLFLILKRKIIYEIKEGKEMKELKEKIWRKVTMFGITLSTMMAPVLSFAAVEGIDPKETFTAKTGTDATDGVKNFGNNILGMVSTAASVIAVIILIVLGVKYMMGSAEEKAEYKKTLLPYFLGAIFVFGAGAICAVIFNVAGTDWTQG